MRITHVRVRKLVSLTAGYGHDAIEMEAEVQDGESFESVVETLNSEIAKQLHKKAEERRLWRELDSLQRDVMSKMNERDGLDREIKAQRKIIREHDKLLRLAKEHGIDAQALDAALNLPF